ncbi:MAG: lipoate--protein ligase family protein [Planctomycetota bacterium]|nr:MAG: lipoate--protein ligase family protein [Planctomycetota bacterium]
MSAAAIPARRIDDPALAGALNMALDEVLLALRREPTLRFYRWARPTLSLGWFQAADELPLAAVRARGGDVVRRTTGGKAILHQDELTYSLCAPETGALAGGPAKAMRRLHELLAAELARQAGRAPALRGPRRLASDVPGSPWCFEDSSPLDLGLDGRKLLGSAARRRRGWILFHGSLVVRPPAETPGIAGLGFEPDRDGLAAALGRGLGYDFRPGRWREEERATAKRIAAARFGREEFTRRR